MTSDKKLPAGPSSSGDVNAFLNKVAAAPAIRPGGGSPGRLLFAIDATASREPAWDMACQIQAEMFAETQNLGWSVDPAVLLSRLRRVQGDAVARPLR